jgi:hypothetical protein
MKTLVYYTITLALIAFTYKVKGQNNLYKKNDGSVSVYFGVFSEDLRDRDAIGYGANYTKNYYIS